MATKGVDRKQKRARRHERIRRKVRGTAARPRMALCVSDRNMYVQFIDDDRSHTLASVSTLGQDAKVNVTSAGVLGRRAAEAALEKGIREVVVDRGGFRFHGRIKAIVDGARAAGLVAGDVAAADAQTAEDQQ